MSDTWVGPGWWLANDGRWYPPTTDETHAAAVDKVLAHRAADEPFTLDLRTNVAIVTPASVPIPPAVPTESIVESVSESPAEAEEPVARSGARPSAAGADRWGSHRRVATPIRSRPTR